MQQLENRDSPSLSSKPARMKLNVAGLRRSRQLPLLPMKPTERR
jgi:hypothetical protein